MLLYTKRPVMAAVTLPVVSLNALIGRSSAYRLNFKRTRPKVVLVHFFYE